MNMISKTFLTFLRDLKTNNNKEWFTANKCRYESSKNEFEEFIKKLIKEIQKFDLSVAGTDPKKAIFRIYRDIRFSKDKSPYKVNFGAHIHAGNRQEVHSIAGYYFHIEPGGKSILAGGAYMPPPDWIKAIREEINYSGKEFHKVIDDKIFKSYFTLEGEKLHRPPQGFDTNHEDIEFLKYKSLIAVHKLTDKQIMSADFIRHCAKVSKSLSTFTKFLNQCRI